MLALFYDKCPPKVNQPPVEGVKCMKNGKETRAKFIGELSKFRQGIAKPKALETDPEPAKEEVHHLSSFPELNPNPILEVNLAGQVVYSNSAAQRAMARLGLPDLRASLL
jgi:hypothetical protein